MWCKESKNVNSSDRSYEAKMTTYISYKSSRNSAKLIWTWENNIRIWNSRHKISEKEPMLNGREEMLFVDRSAVRG